MRVPPSGGSDFSSFEHWPTPTDTARELGQKITDHLEALYTASKEGTLRLGDLKAGIEDLDVELTNLRVLTTQLFPAVFTTDQKSKIESLYNALMGMGGRAVPSPTTDDLGKLFQIAQDLKF